MAIIWELTSTAGGELNARLGLYSTVTNRGFTGHEHLDSVGLIHMNGRAYDPELGRFLSVDPFIQFPDNSQSLNPYTYVMNNPLSGTDPTGYMGMFGGGVSFGNPFGGNSSNPYGGIGRPIHPPRGPTQCEIMCVSTKGADGGSAPTNIEEKPKDKTANIENQKDGNSVVTKAASGTVVTVNRSNIAPSGSTNKSTNNLKNIDRFAEPTTTTNKTEEEKNYKLHLLASKNLPVGHVAIAGESPDGETEAKGFYPKEKSADIAKVGIRGFVKGTVKNDIELLRDAQAGADGVLMQTLNVTKAQHDTALQFMSDYADNNLYNLYRNSCVTAALKSLNAAGVSKFETKMGADLLIRRNYI